MSGFPASWETALLGDLCRIELGKTPARANARLWDSDKATSNVWLSISDMPDSLHAIATDSREYVADAAAREMRLVPEGALLVSFKLTLGRLCYAGRDLYTNEAIAALLELDRTRIFKKYLYWYLAFFDWKAAAKGDEKVKGKALNKAKLKVLPILLPPLDEQKRIVAKLDQAFVALDRARANAESNLADADELLERASARVIEGKAGGTLRPLRLSEVTSRLTNGYVGPTRDIYRDDGVPYLLARHVRNGSLRFDGRTYISSEFNQKHKKSMLKQNDVLLVQSGHIGHSAVVPKAHHGHNCHAMIVMTPRDELVSGKYLSAVFNTPMFKAEFQRIRTGSTVPHLTCGMVRELVVEVPDRAQQDLIVTELETFSSDIDALRSRYIAELEDLESLRQSLLQAAFSGQLT